MSSGLLSICRSSAGPARVNAGQVKYFYRRVRIDLFIGSESDVFVGMLIDDVAYLKGWSARWNHAGHPTPTHDLGTGLREPRDESVPRFACAFFGAGPVGLVHTRSDETFPGTLHILQDKRSSGYAGVPIGGDPW